MFELSHQKCEFVSDKKMQTVKQILGSTHKSNTEAKLCNELMESETALTVLRTDKRSSLHSWTELWSNVYRKHVFNKEQEIWNAAIEKQSY